MKKDDRFLAFSFFKKCRWLRVVIALIFLLNICAPAWARDGNSGKTGAWLTLGSGALVGAVTVVSVLISPWGGFAGSVIGDLAGFAMYYYDYSDYGKTWIKIGKMEISKGSVVSMTAGIAAASVASFISGAAEATVKETTKTALEEAGKTAITNTATNVATNVATNAVTGLVTSTMTAAMKEAAKKAAEEALKKAAIEASGGLISSLVNSVVQLPVNIIKALWQFIITVFKTPIQALETLVKSLGQAVGTFFKTIYYGFLKTLQNIGSFFADPVKYIKKMFENIKTRQATANPYYRYGTEGSIDKALVQLSGDLGVGLIKLVVSEYIKQNLQAGIYRKGKGGKKIEIIGPVDETIAGMVGNMVSNYVGASVNVVVMRSLGKAFGWNIDNQGGFLDKGEVNPNMVVKVNNNTGKDVTLSEVYNATGGKIDPNKKDPYTITKSDGTTVNVTGQELIVNNPELSGADGNGGQLKAYGEGIQNLSNMSKGANVLSSDKKATIQNLSEAGATVVDGKVVGGKKFDADGNLLVSLNDGSTAKVNIKNLKSDDISNLQTYNTAIAGYVKAFGQYGALVMGDPSRSISIEVTGKDGVKWTTRVSVGELASNKDLIAADNTTDGKVSGNYEITLKTGEKVIISGDSLNTQMVGQLKTYSVMLNSSYYSQLFKMTGGLMYTLNGKDMNTQGVLRSGIEAVRNMGLAPLISTATRVALLKIMDYRTHYGNDEGRIYENLWKMAVANAGSNIFTDLVNNSNFVSKLAYGLEPGQNPFQTRGSMSLGLHMANKVVEEGVGMLSQIGWGYYCKQKDIAPSAVNELVHLAGATLGAGIIDIFRQDSGKAKVVDINGNTIYDEKGKSLYKPVSESDQSPILKSRLSLDNVGDSFVKSVVGDFKNQFIEAALDSSLFPFAIRSPGTGPNAFMNQWGVYDKFSQQISAISQGSSPIDADLMRLSSNLSYRADANFSQSLSAIISNRFLPENFRSYAFFTEYNGIADYTPDRTYKENISSDNKEKVKKRLEELKENNLLYRENEIGEENPETRAELSKQLENNRESFKEGKDKIDQAESTLNEPYHLLDTYRLSIAGVPQDQVTYGNAQKGDVILEGNSTQENGETGINSIKNKEEAVFMPRYQEGVTKLEEATVDQFGRLQNTYYYDSNGERQDKYAQHFYGAFGHQLSVTKDSTQENAVQTTQQLSAGWKSNLAEYWDKLAGEFSTAAEIKPVDLAKQLGVEITGEESSEELKTKFINYVETRLGSAETDVIGEIAGKVDLIAKNKKVLASEKIIGANFRDLIPTGKVVGKDFVVNMNSKAIKLLKEAQQDLLSGQGIKVGEEVAKAIPLSKEAGLAFVARLDETYVDKDGIVRTYGDDISKLTEDTWKKSGRTNKETLFAILYASAMFAPQADGREWKELTPKEKHNVLSGVVGWRLATAGLYDRDGVKQTLKKGNNTTNVLYMGSSADVMDLNKIQTIYVPGIITPGKEITAPGSVNKPEYDTITTQREASPNYSYSLSLYSTGSGRSPYSGPAYQLNAREVNSGAQLGNGVGKLLGVSVNEYHRIKNMKSSGITAFSDQTTLPSWSVDTSYGMDGAWIPEGSMARKYSYETDVIATEIGKAVKGNLDTKTTPESKATVAALQHTQFTDIKDIAGKNITLVSDPAEKENTLNAFYKEYKVGENNSSIGSDPVFSKLDFKGTKSTSVTDNKSYQDAVTPVPVDSPIVAPEEDFLRRMRPTDASMIADNTLKSGPNDPQSDAVDPMAGTSRSLETPNAPIPEDTKSVSANLQAEKYRSDYLNYMNHPSYKKRLSKEMFGDIELSSQQEQDVEKEYNRRKQAVEDVTINLIANDIFSNYDPKLHQVDAGSEAIYHELSHSVDASSPSYDDHSNQKDGFDKAKNKLESKPVAELNAFMSEKPMLKTQENNMAFGKKLREYYIKNKDALDDFTYNQIMGLLSDESLKKDFKTARSVYHVVGQVKSSVSQDSEFPNLPIIDEGAEQKYDQLKTRVDYYDKNTEIKARLNSLRIMAIQKYGYDLNKEFNINDYKELKNDAQYKKLNEKNGLSDEEINVLMKYTAENNENINNPSVNPPKDFLFLMKPNNELLMAYDPGENDPNGPQSDAVDPMAGMIYNPPSLEIPSDTPNQFKLTEMDIQGPLLTDPEYIKARDEALKSGLRHFNFNGKSYKAELPYHTSEVELFKKYGTNHEIEDNRPWWMPIGLAESISSNIFPEGFNIGPDRPLSSMLKAVITNTPENNTFSRMENWHWYGTDLRSWDAVKEFAPARILVDGFRMALGRPQKYNSYEVSEYAPSEATAKRYKRVYGEGEVTYQIKNGEDLSKIVVGPVDTAVHVLQLRPNMGTSTIVIRGTEKIKPVLPGEGTIYSTAFGQDITRFEQVPGNFMEAIDIINYKPFGKNDGRDSTGITGYVNKLIDNKFDFPYYERIYTPNTTNAPLPRSAQPNPLNVLYQSAVPVNH